MAEQHQTTVSFRVEVKARDDVEAKLIGGLGEWFLWADYGIAIGLARETRTALQKQGREARIVKTTITTTREVVDEKT